MNIGFDLCWVKILGEYNRKLDIKYSQTASALGLVPMFGSCSNFEVPIVLIPSILPRSRRPTQCPAGRSPEGGFSAAGSVLVLRWSSFSATSSRDRTVWWSTASPWWSRVLPETSGRRRSPRLLQRRRQKSTTGLPQSSLRRGEANVGL